MIFTTETGSRYEIDTDNNRIRRLSGESSPTSRQGKDGDWRVYNTISDVAIGAQLMIVWNNSDTPLLEGSQSGSTPATMTSQIVSILQ